MGASNDKNEMRYIRVTDLEPDPDNPQSMKAPEFERLCDEISNNGFIVPMQVTPIENGKFRIIGGEHRWKAAQVNQLEEVPCMILKGPKWEDNDLRQFVMVRLNVLSGKLDPMKFHKIYEEKAKKYGEEALQGLFGFVDSHLFQKLKGDLAKGMKTSLPKGMGKEFEELSKEAKTVDDLSKIIQHLFIKYGDTIDQSFMIFSHGKQEHLYVSMDKDTKKAMDKVVQYCKLTGSDINSIMAPICEKAMTEVEERLAHGETLSEISKK